MCDVINDLELEIKDDVIIKVMGVGGGGCNAVNYLYSQGVKDVSFLVCNTDKQALGRTSIPAKLQLGPGLGAGGKPEVAQGYAEQNKDRIREALNDGTKMLFLTAGMGGGTGTGASSVVAEVAKEMDILTVGIVTIPFAFEGAKKIKKAMTGVAQLAENVDAILVINNEKLREIYPDFTFLNAFSKSNDVVANAARAIAEIITVTGIINTDFTDVYNTLSSGNVAILSVGTAGGEDRINASIHEALTSPLVNSDVKGAKRVLLQLYCSSEHPIIMQEFVCEMGNDVEVQWGVSLDESLGENVRVTLIATGFEVSDIPGLDDAVGKKTVDEAIDSFYKDAASHPASATEEAEKTPKPAPNVLQDGELIIDLDDNLVGEKAVEFVPTITPERETNNDLAKQTGRPGIAGWMRGRR